MDETLTSSEAGRRVDSPRDTAVAKPFRVGAVVQGDSAAASKRAQHNKASNNRDGTGPEPVANTPAWVRFRRPISVLNSVLFGLLFVTSIALTMVGIFFALSNDAARAAQALPILQINLVFLALLSALVVRQVWRVLFSKTSRRSAPLLHRRFVIIFSLAALTPAVLVGAFSTTLITQNINDALGRSTRGDMEQAQALLNSYLKDERADLLEDVGTMERALNVSPDLLTNRISNTVKLGRARLSLGFDAVYLITRDGLVLSRVEGPDTPELRIPVRSFIDSVKPGDIAFQQRDDIDYLVALTELDNYPNVFLYSGRYLRSDSQVLSSISGITESQRNLDSFIEDQNRVERVFLLTFFETVVLILIAAVWLGIVLANRIIEPLGKLVAAAEAVRGGDLSARVAVERDWGEMSDLGSAFNRMTRQLSSQRDELIREHDISEQRRQFSEAVLSGVRAGVIGLTQEGRITLMNSSGERLLGQSSQSMLGHPIETVLAEFEPAFRSAREDVTSASEDQVSFETPNGTRIFDLRVSAYQGPRKDTGWVLTFDDMTRLVAAQRHSAWREVARRIAHEIKNPLTPIQLSAERLQRKFGAQIPEDRDIFDNCTQTIMRQVASLERMVDEFSAFARMPAPVFDRVDLRDVINAIVFEQGVASPEIKISFEGADRPAPVLCDERLISQALTNVTKNAAEAIDRRIDMVGESTRGGHINISLLAKDSHFHIVITDNGMGWPLPDRERLLEPYVTTRDTGTGLGLAIVQRVAEDHGGFIKLSDRDDGASGAVLSFALPIAGHIISDDTQSYNS